MKHVFKLAGLFLLILSINFVYSCKKDKPVSPSITTASVTSISYTTAVSGGNLADEGSSPVLSMGICWSTSTGSTIEDSKTTQNGTVGSFVSNIEQLTPNTKYYLRAYAINSDGIGYGSEVSFTTTAIGTPMLATIGATSLTESSAISGGNITKENGATVTARGVCWSTTTNPTISDSKTTDGTGMGEFKSNITNLSEGTVYHIRAYATNSAGTSYGEDLTITTLSRPILSTNTITNITTSAAIGGGNITSDGGSLITERGVCWNTSGNPVTDDKRTIETGGSVSFTSNISELTPNTRYYMRAYATNSTGTGYGNEQIFQTDPAIVTDIDGNIYNVVRIGTQLWMKENLKATKNTDGTSIALVNTEFNWTNLTVNSKAYCWLNDNIINKDTYGALYTWAAAQEVCPAGWHLPVDDEWTTLITYSGGLDIAGNILKETGTTHWSTPNSATNITGFTALPGGGRDIIGSFWGAGYFGSWWTSTQADAENAWISSMSYISGYMQRGSRSKFLGQSVRCIKNTN